MKKLLPALAAVGALLAVTVDAQAQTDTFYLDRAQPSMAPDDGIMGWRPVMRKDTTVYASAAVGGTLNPLRVDNITNDAIAKSKIDNPVQAQFLSYLGAGLQIRSRLSVGVMVPFVLEQITGDDPQGQGIGSGGLHDAGAAVGDVRLDGRVRLFEDDTRTLRLGFGAAVWVPTGDPEAYFGDDDMTTMVYGSGEIDFGPFFLTGMIGPHFRPARGIPGENSRLFIDDEMRYAFGAFLPLRSGSVRLGGELWGTFGIADGAPPAGAPNDSATGANNFALEWMGQTRFSLNDDDSLWANIAGGTRLSNGYGAADVRLMLSAGYAWSFRDRKPEGPPKKIVIVPDAEDYEKDTDKDGFPDDIDKCPTVKEDGKPPNPTDGCPAPPDRDGDGIFDADDECPDNPEDFDGIEDRDGCPEEDVDNDGIPDTEDACPLEPGPASEDPEKNGCPGLTRFESNGTITLLQPIQFEYNKATIKEVSYPILDEVVVLMKARPEISIGVYGHTDNKGGRAYNIRLSKARAAACMEYLKSKGIAEARLQSEGFGPDKPVADNSTEEGRAKNRRVDFKVIEGLESGEESGGGTDGDAEGEGGDAEPAKGEKPGAGKQE